MGLRLYISPIVGDGLSIETAYRPKIAGLARPMVPLIPSNPDGTPKFGWTLLVARSADWTTIDADTQNDRLFDIDLPDTVETFAELKSFLQSRRVSDIPAGRRQTLVDKLTSRGIDTSKITPATTWWQVLRGVMRHLNDGVLPAGDGLSIA